MIDLHDHCKQLFRMIHECYSYINHPESLGIYAPKAETGFSLSKYCRVSPQLIVFGGWLFGTKLFHHTR